MDMKNNVIILEKFIQSCCSNLIANNSESENAIEYLKFRGINNDSIDEYKIGYCSLDCELPYEISNYGQELVGTIRDISYFVKGRIVIPVYGEFDEIVGFATRKPTFQKGETWWNLPSPFYKGRHLYLLNKAKDSIYKENKAYMVEGYIDGIYLRQEGLKNTVALMGTALTSRKVGLLARYCSNICVAMDVDSNNSGQIACKKSICQIKKLNFCDSLSVISKLPVGVDPDEYVKEHGMQSFLNCEEMLTDEQIKKYFLDIEEEEKSKIQKAKDARKQILNK